MSKATLTGISKQNLMSFFSPKVLAVCTLLGLCEHSFAQKGFDAGGTTGFQTSMLMNKEDKAAGAQLKSAMRPEVPVGAEVGYTFSEHIGVGVGFSYSRQGQSYTGSSVTTPDTNALSTLFAGLAKINQIDMSGNYTADIALGTFKVPVMFRYTGDRSKKVYFTAYIGPQLNWLNFVTYHVNKFEAPVKKLIGSSTQFYNTMTVDGVLGIGAGFNIGPNVILTTTARADYGFQDVEKKDVMFAFEGGGANRLYSMGRSKTNNMTAGVQVGISYIFKCKEKEELKTTAKKK